MLAESTSKIKVGKVESEIKVKDLYQKHIDLKNASGIENIEILSFNPMTKRISFRNLRKLAPFKQNKNVLKITLDMGEDATKQKIYYSFIVNVTSQIYVNTNGRPTAIAANALKTWRIGKIAVAFVQDDNSLKFYPIVSVCDPIAEIQARNNKILSEQKVETEINGKKPGRKKKSVFVLEAIPLFGVYKAETGDGSFIICDRVIIK